MRAHNINLKRLRGRERKKRANKSKKKSINLGFPLIYGCEILNDFNVDIFGFSKFQHILHAKHTCIINTNCFLLKAMYRYIIISIQ